MEKTGTSASSGPRLLTTMTSPSIEDSTYLASSTVRDPRRW
ncbi:hypothetical protein [Sorangium sp. So ce542]